MVFGGQCAAMLFDFCSLPGFLCGYPAGSNWRAPRPEIPFRPDNTTAAKPALSRKSVPVFRMAG